MHKYTNMCETAVAFEEIITKRVINFTNKVFDCSLNNCED